MALTVKSNQSDLDTLIANLQSAVDAINNFELKYSVVSEEPQPEATPETPVTDEQTTDTEQQN